MNNDNFMMSGINTDITNIPEEKTPEEAKDPNAEIIQEEKNTREDLQAQNLKHNGEIQRLLEAEIENIKYWTNIGSTGDILAMDSEKLGDVIKNRASSMDYLTTLLNKLEPFDD